MNPRKTREARTSAARPSGIVNGRAYRLASERLRLRREGTRKTGYDVLTRLALKPGRYELRVGMKGSDRVTSSVYASAEVPNFEHGDLSLSGLVLTANPRPKVGGESEISGLLPILPTARRTFHATDQVIGFVRLYEGKAQILSPVTVTTRVVDRLNNAVSTTTQRVERGVGVTSSTADHQFDVPLRDLAPGEYLLAVDASLGSTTAQRALRFKVD